VRLKKIVIYKQAMIEEQTTEENKKSEERERILKEVKGFEKSPWVFLIRKNRLTYLIVAFLIIFGLLTIRQLPKELNPEVEIPIAVIVTAYPGASPPDVEEQVTKEIENQISDTEGLKKIDSDSSLGFSSITVEFEADRDVETSIGKLKDEVDKVKNDLPEDATDPQVVEISLDDQAIFSTTLTGENYDVADLKKFAEDIKKEIKNVPYVSDVAVIGGRDRVIKVDVNQDKISQAGISLQEIIRTLTTNNVNFPVGSIELGDSNYSIRIEGEFKTAQEIGSLTVGFVDGKPILLSDVAKVEDGFGKERSRSRLSVKGSEPMEAVTIQVFKKTGGDITEVVEDVKKRIEKRKGIDYPEDVNVEVTMDLSTYISESIEDLSKNGMTTIVIIFILLFVFLGWKEALIAGLSVPFSFFISFIFMAVTGESLNFLSLFSLILALGLLVDSAIVIVEGMYNKIASYSVTGYQAAISTVKEYATPLLTGILTTVAAFLPLLFIEGIMGQFMKTIPVVVITTLLAALFVSLTIVPAIGATFLDTRKKKKPSNKKTKHFLKKHLGSEDRGDRWANRIFEKISKRYYNFIPKLIGSRRKRRFVMITIWILFFISISLPITGMLKVQSFSTPDSEYFFINIETPSGTTLEKTDGILKRVEDIVRTEPEVTNFSSNAGSGMTFSLGSADKDQGNLAFIQINLAKKGEREITSTEIVSRLREKTEKEITDAKVSFLEESAGPPSGAAVEVRVVGEDLLVLEELAEQIKDQLKTIPTVIDAKTSMKLSSGEFVFIPNKDILAEKGLSVVDISQELYNGVSHNKDVKINKEGEEIKVDVSYDEDNLKSLNEIQAVKIKTPTGEEVAISELGEIELMPSLASIKRRDEERVVSVTSGTDGGNPTEISQELQIKLADMSIPSGYRIIYGGEQEELTEIYQDMLLKMFVAVILILFILVIQFNSYKKVLLILSTILFAIIGVFIGLTITGMTLDIPAFIGIVSLVGIVVNNAIILVDRINKELEKKGRKLVSAVQEAGYVRLRPIILTTITTIFGLLPLSIAQPEWRNMGFAIIFGLAFSTLLTLFVLPTMFVSFYRKKIK
jgi:multidrug efflux pump subunit AcrB